MDLLDRKNKLKEIALNNNYNGAMIYRLIDSDLIDNIIKKLGNRKVKSSMFKLSEKGYLTSEENFINTLSEFIDFFCYSFPTLQRKGLYVLKLLDEIVPSFLISNYYCGDYTHIKYFNYNMKKLCVLNFYSNIKVVYNEYSDFFIDKGISTKMILTSKNIDRLFKLLQEFVLTNCKFNDKIDRPMDCLFECFELYIDNKYMVVNDDTKAKAKEEYIIYYDELISNYNKKIDAVKKLLNK